MKSDIAYDILIKETSDLYKAQPAPKSLGKIKTLAKKIAESNWRDDIIAEYVDHAYRKLKTNSNRSKRSSVNYFIAILVSERTFGSFLDYVAADNTDTPEVTEDTISFKGKEYTPLTEKDDVEVFYNYNAKDDKFMFVVRDSSFDIPRINFLSTYNKRNKGKKINRTALKRLASIK